MATKQKAVVRKPKKELKSRKDINLATNGMYDIHNIELFRKVSDHIANGDSIEEACKKEGKPYNFYFRFQAENIMNEEVSNISTRARVQKSHGYFDKCEQALKNLETDVFEPHKARVLFDGYLRLAGKANQGLYGDKVQQDVTVKGDIDITKHFSKEDLIKAGKEFIDKNKKDG